MKRFYKTATVDPGDDGSERGGWVVRLDGRELRSPARQPMLLPTRALASAIRDEWATQGEEIEPTTMPMMRFAATAVDRVAPRPEGVIDELGRFASTDLVCYRAASPVDLVERQARLWQPLVDRFRARHGADFRVTEGILPVEQPAETVAAARGAIADRSVFALAGLFTAASAAGSVVIGLALADGDIDAVTAIEAAQVDERYQLGRWGEDPEAVARLDHLATELREARRFLDLLE